MFTARSFVLCDGVPYSLSRACLDQLLAPADVASDRPHLFTPMVTIGWPRAHNGFEFTTRLNDLSWIYGPCFDLKQSYTRANQNYTIMYMC